MSIKSIVQRSKVSRKQWVQEAIREHLASIPPRNNQASDAIKALNIEIDTDLHSQVEKALEGLEPTEGKIPKSHWILRAINDKLEREKGIQQELAQHLSSSDF